MANYDAVVISLGAGVQSTVLTLMADRGAFDGPAPTHAIFADTHAEPKAVYENLDWLETELCNIEVIRTDGGRNLARDVWLNRGASGRTNHVQIPVYYEGAGMANRQCTRHYKITVIERTIRETVLGLAPATPLTGKTVIQWMGISWDERVRMADPLRKWQRFRYPLVEHQLTRPMLNEWFKLNYPDRPALPRSACVFCPFRHPDEWRALKRDDRAGFDKAVRFDERLRSGSFPKKFNHAPYLHTARRPLEEAVERSERIADEGEQGAFDLGGALSDCSGVCFV